MMEHPAFFKVAARAWTDAAFEAELLSEPAAALAKMGLSPPAGVTLKVRKNMPETMHLVLPTAPAGYHFDAREWDDWTA